LIERRKTMRAVERLWHKLFVIAMLILLVGIPFATHLNVFSTRSDPDAISSATVKLPDQPSGEFFVFINSNLHRDTLSDWENFFSGKDLPVIFDDIRCIAANGDASGIQFAERFRAQLPENQMTLRTENPTLLISKIEKGYIDVAVISGEMAGALSFNKFGLTDEITVIHVRGNG